MLLGHSELRVTADLYTHLVTQTAAKAARHMDAVLRQPLGCQFGCQTVAKLSAAPEYLRVC